MIFNKVWSVCRKDGGHNQKDTNMSVAATQPGVSINDLTDVNRVDLLTGNAALNGTPVAIKVAT